MINTEPNYLSQYSPYIQKYVRASRQNMTPLNIYKIQTYRYADGVVRRKLGLETSLIFSVGIYLKELYCIRLNEIKPAQFFTWSNRIFNRDSLNEIKDETISFRSVIKEFNENGRDLFLNHIKPSSVVYKNQNKQNFRTYLIKNIIYTQEAVFDMKKIKEIYG
jgi:hypothetical protein